MYERLCVRLYVYTGAARSVWWWEGLEAKLCRTVYVICCIHRAGAFTLKLTVPLAFLLLLLPLCPGAFPLWLAPVQVRLMPVNEAVMPYIMEVGHGSG